MTLKHEHQNNTCKTQAMITAKHVPFPDHSPSHNLGAGNTSPLSPLFQFRGGSEWCIPPKTLTKDITSYAINGTPNLRIGRA